MGNLGRKFRRNQIRRALERATPGTRRTNIEAMREYVAKVVGARRGQATKTPVLPPHLRKVTAEDIEQEFRK